MPAEIKYGYVADWVALAEGDGPDEGSDPDARYPENLTVTFTPKTTTLAVTGPIPGRVFPQPVTATIGPDGYLTDGQGAHGVWLVVGQYTVVYKHPAVPALSFVIEVTEDHTNAAPLYLSDAQPPGGTPLTPSEYAELAARIVALENGGNVAGVASVNGQTGALIIDAADVGALPDTYTPPAQSWSQITSKPTTFSPTAHVHAIADVTNLQAALDGKAATSHTHTAGQVSGLSTVATTGAYADLSGTPTIPGPQTLSLAGSDLTLSDGGGTVTLPTGGGGGSTSWADITGKPVNFPPSSHTHSLNDLTTTGTPSASTYLRGDGQWTALQSSWQELVNTSATFNSSSDRLANFTIEDDGTSTGSWPDRWTWYFKPQGESQYAVWWINEYGEWRGMCAKSNTVGNRVFVANDATSFAQRDASVPAWEVSDFRNGAGSRNTVAGVYKDRFEAQKIVCHGDLTAGNFDVAGIAVDPTETPPNGWLVIRTQ